MEDYGSRIKELRKALDLTQIEMAQKIGISRELLASLESNARRLRQVYVMVMHDRLGANEAWLMSGEGTMLERDRKKAAKNASDKLAAEG